MKQSQSLPSKKQIETLLDHQTKVILSAVDQKLQAMELRINRNIDKKSS